MRLTEPPPSFGPRTWITPAKLVALGLLIFGAKLMLMRVCSTSLPFFDQWQGEGRDLIQASLHGRLRWTDLFAFHVQHRILWTRLIVLGLFHVNGQWDTQVEMIAGALIHTLCAAVLGAILIRRLGPACENCILFCLAGLFVLPFGWENTLSGGFQTQYYCLILFVSIALWGLCLHRPWTAPWWSGMVCAVAAWFALATGPVAGAVVAGMMAIQLWRREGNPRANWTTLVVGVALCSGLLVTIGGGIPGAHLEPTSPGEFVAKWLGLLGWPNVTPWAAIAAYAPLAFLLIRRLRRKPAHTEADDGAATLVLALGGFAILQATALAYARNHYRDLSVSRYMDFLSLGTLANFAALLLLAREGFGDARARRWFGALGALWVAVTVLGLSDLTENDLTRDLPFIKANNASEEIHVPAFMAHPDRASLKGDTTFDFQCEQPDLLTNLLSDPLVQAVMPARARAGLSLVAAQEAGTPDPLPPGVGRGPVAGSWVLRPPGPGDAMTRFRSRTLTSHLAYLEFSVLGTVGEQASLELVGERSGQRFPLESTTPTGGWWTARVAVPSEPFHVEAAVKSAGDGLVLLAPKAIGRLSAWVDGLFDAATGIFFAGAALWLGMIFVQRAKMDADHRDKAASTAVIDELSLMNRRVEISSTAALANSRHSRS